MNVRNSFLLLLLLTTLARAQEVVTVGKGSYASSPPKEAHKAAHEMTAQKFPFPADKPIPTNQNWTHLLKGKPNGQLWIPPFRIDPNESGATVFYPTRWNDKGSDPLCENPIIIEGADFKSPKLEVKNWGDWTLTFRLPRSDEKFLDITVGQGMPFVWVEPTGVPLTLKLAGDAKFADKNGKEIKLPFTGNELAITTGGRTYGIFTPDNTTFEKPAASLLLKTDNAKPYLALAAMKDSKDLAAFSNPARNIPRDSQMNWTYDPKWGTVKTTWAIKTDSLLSNPTRPATSNVIQGFLPHHYRSGKPAFKLEGPEYLSSRGTMKSAIGNNFEIDYHFDGFLPVLPAPAKTSTTFDPARMSKYLEAAASKTKYGDDTYWGGKDLLRPAQHMLFAKQLDDPSTDELKQNTRTALADWYTYTPGEKAHYFARYENWHALVGFKGSYDSERFNDHHFHYGYFTNATAMLAMEDPDFLKDYGDMARLVAKEYANYDRKDTRFPFLRTFDIWRGHSFAGGLGSPGGNNQESTSEAVQSWAGLFLLGTMLDDKEMTAAGAMGYAIESKATMEYWFNQFGDNLPKEYKHPTVGILWSGGNAYATYFSGEPAWIYGIQTLPVTPALEYLAIDPAFAKKSFATALELQKAKKGSDDPGKMGDLGNVLLAHASKFDPDYVTSTMDRLWKDKNDLALKHADAGTIYYYAHAYQALGQRDYTIHLTIPTAAAYTKANVTTYAAYNPKYKPINVEVYKDGKIAGTFFAQPRTLTTITKLSPPIYPTPRLP